MIVGELIAAYAELVVFLALAATLLVELLLTGVAFVLELLLGLLFGWRGGANATNAASAAGRAPPMAAGWLMKIARSQWLRRIGVVSGACLAVTIVFVLLLNTVFFDWTVRRIVGSVAGRSGIVINYAAAEGNLLAGRIELREALLVRREHPATVFDLRAERLAIDLDVLSMIGRQRRVESARAAGLRGTIERRAAGESKPWHTRRSVRIDQLDFTDVRVEWIDHTRGRDAGTGGGGRPMRVALAIDGLSGRDLRTRWIAFDLLFRTSGTGRLAERPFTVSNERTATGGGKTLWAFQGLPAPLLGEFVGGPLAWVREGDADVLAKTQWSGSHLEQLKMSWSFDFRGLRAEVPRTVTGGRARVADAIVKHLNEHGERLPLTFDISLDGRNFEGSASAEAAGLWQALADAMTKEFARALGIDQSRSTQQLRQEVKQNALERLRSLRSSTTRGAGA